VVKQLVKWLDGDLGHSFKSSPVAMGAALLAFVCVFCAVFAPWIAPHNPFDLATLELSQCTAAPSLAGGAAIPRSCWAPMTRGETSCLPSCTAHAYRWPWGWHRWFCRCCAGVGIGVAGRVFWVDGSTHC
jgi:ABC-type dipeptide/oligopeptide/nickel transport system permease subunit